MGEVYGSSGSKGYVFEAYPLGTKDLELYADKRSTKYTDEMSWAEFDKKLTEKMVALGIPVHDVRDENNDTMRMYAEKKQYRAEEGETDVLGAMAETYRGKR